MSYGEIVLPLCAAWDVEPSVLEALRKIGWNEWDPLYLLEFHKENGIDNEYDTYLIQAASALWSGMSEATVIKYLIRIVAFHMGMGINDLTEKEIRATATVQAIIRLKPL